MCARARARDGGKLTATDPRARSARRNALAHVFGGCFASQICLTLVNPATRPLHKIIGDPNVDRSRACARNNDDAVAVALRRCFSQ